VSESIIVGLVIGGGVAVIGTLVSYYVRRWEQKSERRRELYERDLRIVRDLADTVTWARAEMTKPASLLVKGGRDSRASLVGEVVLMAARAHVVTISLRNQNLRERCDELFGSFVDWLDTLDWDTGKPVGGKKQEFDKLLKQMEQAAAEVLRRIRQILEEV